MVKKWEIYEKKFILYCTGIWKSWSLIFNKGNKYFIKNTNYKNKFIIKYYLNYLFGILFNIEIGHFMIWEVNKTREYILNKFIKVMTKQHEKVNLLIWLVSHW